MVVVILCSWELGLKIAMIKPIELKKEKSESLDSSWSID
jgi:hypothetical protein